MSKPTREAYLGLVVDTMFFKNAHPVREREPVMDSAVKQIHSSDAFSLENVAKATREALERKKATRRAS